MQQADEHLSRRRLAIVCILWISVGVVWYVAVRFWLPSHPMPGTAIVVLTSFSAVASAVVEKFAVNRQFVSHVLSYVTVAFCTVLIATILALFIICCFYFLYFSKWPNWPAIRYNLVLDVAWIGVHVTAASTVMKLVNRTQLGGY